VRLPLILLLAAAATTSPATGATQESTPNLQEARKELISTPAPKYPTVARRDRLEGAGVFHIHFDIQTGQVRRVTVLHSTGHAVLDEASIIALRQWKIKPHTFQEIKVPLSFRLVADDPTSASASAHRESILYAPAPRYPLSALAEGVPGRGLFQLLIDTNTGQVTEVKILHTSGDVRLDSAALKAFRQWRFRPHTLKKLTVPMNFSIRYG
jgi:TonB family protein